MRVFFSCCCCCFSCCVFLSSLRLRGELQARSLVLTSMGMAYYSTRVYVPRCGHMYAPDIALLRGVLVVLPQAAVGPLTMVVRHRPGASCRFSMVRAWLQSSVSLALLFCGSDREVNATVSSSK